MLRLVLLLLVLAGIAVPIGFGGGYDSTPQWTFVAIAAAAAVVAIAYDRRRALSLALSAPILVLIAIALLEAVSAAWTIWTPAAAVRNGAVVAGFAGLALGAGVAARSGRGLAAAIAVAAALTALSGLVAAVVHSPLYAERIEGGWRPEGPFGYPAALALLQVCALPALMTAMARARLLVAGLAAAGLTLAASILVLATNRLTLALAVLLLGVALVVPERTVGARRGLVAAAAVLMACAGLAFYELRAGWASRHAEAGAGQLAALLLIPVAAAMVWMLFRRYVRSRTACALEHKGEHSAGPNVSQRRTLAAGLAVLAVAVATGLLSADPLSARRIEVHESFAHGRTWMWSASLHTALDRPLQGHGAGSFLLATIERQRGGGHLTRFAHNLPLELAVEVGFLGLVLGIALYAAAGRTLWRARASPAAWLLGPALVAFLVSNLVDWMWHLAGAGAVFAVALGALLRLEHAAAPAE